MTNPFRIHGGIEMAQVVEERQALQDSPWWVRAILMLGIPGAIACVLVWFLISTVKADLDIVKANTEPASAHYAHDTSIDIQLREVANVLRRICVNSAHDSNEREGCLR